MRKRWLAIWFPYLKTDWFTLRNPQLKKSAFALAIPDHGRMVITACNAIAEEEGVFTGMVAADARAIIPSIQILDDTQGLEEKLLNRIAKWAIRYTPSSATDFPGGLILDITGCAHLWGGEEKYLESITSRLKEFGFGVNAAIGDTAGAAKAFARFKKNHSIIQPGQQLQAILSLPAEALGLTIENVERLHKLGLSRISSFINMPRSALRRRFGEHLLEKLDQAVGNKEEFIQPVIAVEPWQERLPSLEPIITATGIEIALKRLLENLCKRLKAEEKGFRIALFKCYRVDGKQQEIEISTNHPTYNAAHLFKLFEIKISTIEPALGIELFILEAKKVEDASPLQEKIWEQSSGLENRALSQLLDRIAGKYGSNSIHRYLPAEHYWPERSFKAASSLDEKSTAIWKAGRPRPLQILSRPEPIEVTAPIPDYPPMLFRYKGRLHKVAKADGPERIEQEWWLQQGQHRDYYCVEDEQGGRYWLFRLGHYHDESYQWFIHGFFA